MITKGWGLISRSRSDGTVYSGEAVIPENTAGNAFFSGEMGIPLDSAGNAYTGEMGIPPYIAGNAALWRDGDPGPPNGGPGFKTKKPFRILKGYGIGRRPTLPPVGQYHRRGRA